MTNKEKTILFIKGLCILLWVGAAVVTSAAVWNAETTDFYNIAAAVNLAVTIGLAGKKAYEIFFKNDKK